MRNNYASQEEPKEPVIYYRIEQGHLMRLLVDYCGDKQVTPADNPQSWVHVCEVGKCGKYEV